MKRRIALLLVLAMLVVGAVATIAAPASAQPGCRAFGALVADAAQRDPQSPLHIGAIASGAEPGTLPGDVNTFFKGPLCPPPGRSG